MDDNYYWPEVTPNDLLSTDLPGRLHLIQHFNENPSRSPPPAGALWEEKKDRGKSFRDLRDGNCSERRKKEYLDSWHLNKYQSLVPITFLDITKHVLNIEGVYVLAEVLKDETLSQLEVLHLGKSKVWELLSKDSIFDPTEPTKCCQRLAGSIVVHRKLRVLRLAGIDLPLSTLRGDADERVLELAHRGLSAIHGLVVAAGLRNNQVLTNVDLRLNTESLGIVGLSALAHAFDSGGVTSLEILNGITVDGMKSLTVQRCEEYELIWIARRIRASCNHRMLKELVLDGVGLNEETGCIVGDMIKGMNRNILLLDLSNNPVLCGIRCDRYGTWRGEPSTKALDCILNSLTASAHVDMLKLNGCSLGSQGIAHLASQLMSGKLKVRQLELRDCSLLFEDLFQLFKALGTTRPPELDDYSPVSEAAVDPTSLEDTTTIDSSVSLSSSAWNRTDLNSGYIDSSFGCTVECLDTRGNPIKRSSEAKLSLLVDDIYDAGVLLCLNGIDFRPYKHLLYGPTSDQDGLEWWKEHRNALTDANETVKLTVASGRVLNVTGVERSSSGLRSERLASSDTLTLQPEPYRRPATTRGGYIDERKPSPYVTPLLDLGSGWLADGSVEGGSLNTSDWANKFHPEQAKERRGLAVHELCFATKMCLRMRVTHMSVSGTRLCGLTALGEGALGISEEDKHIDLEPLRSIATVLKDSSYLLSLDISDNALGCVDGAIPMLADALSETVSLRSLNLRNNRITPLLLEYITGALEMNISVETLELSGNLLGGYHAIRTVAKVANQSLLSNNGNATIRKKVKGMRTAMASGSVHNSSRGSRRQHHSLPERSKSLMLMASSFGATSSQSSILSGGSSATIGKKLAEPLLSSARAVSSIVSRFMHTLTHKNQTVTKLDLRDNGWTDDEKELFADALDVPRSPPFSELRIA